MTQQNAEQDWETKHIIVVDDDERIRELLSRYLEDQGFLVTTAQDAADAKAKLKSLVYDIAIVDVMMPGEDGLSLTNFLKDRYTDMPVLMLTALGEVGDRLEGFEAGVDDYLPKPFEPKELLMRVQAILRRAGSPAQTKGDQITLGSKIFHTERSELWEGEERISLTTVEENLLTTLIQYKNQIISREKICDIMGMNSGERTIDVQVTRLRKKIEDDPKNPRYLQTVRGKGYILKPEREDA